MLCARLCLRILQDSMLLPGKGRNIIRSKESGHVLKFLSVIDSINEWLGRLIVYLVLVLGGVVLYGVLARFLFNAPTRWTADAAMIIWSVYLCLGAGYVLLHKAHVRVDILWSRLSPKKAAIVDLATAAFAFLFLVALVWKGAEWAVFSWKVNETSFTILRYPVYILKTLLVIGAAAFLLQFIAKFIRDIRLVMGRSVE